jgi:hypothetical protein
MITVREVTYDPLRHPTIKHKKARSKLPQPERTQPKLGRSRVVLIPILLFSFILVGFGGVVTARSIYSSFPEEEVVIIVPHEPVVNADGGISPVFSPEIQYWETDILRWAEQYELDPNLIATVMQIESCGDPNAGSSAGAQGLFQVMPFHFTAEEQTHMKHPETNAVRGLNYLKEGLKKSQGHVGLALAGYNGGHGVIDWGWAKMYNETRRYYYWGVGIYEDATNGKQTSSRLQEWLAAGGSSLCNQAAQTQSSLPPR